MEQLPPGFRFYPTEEELISFYLHHKLHAHPPELDRVIPSIDIYSFEPFHLPELAGQVCHGEKEQWFFFMPQQEREARGGRPNRTTASGYWKATGSPSFVYSSQNKVIGVKKTMVFYKGKAPNGRKTKWKMNEYKATKQDDNSLNANVLSASTVPQLRNEVSLCRVYVTSGCARAFDRRPQRVPISDNTNPIHEDFTTRNWNMEIGQGSGTSASPSQGINTTPMIMENSGSTDSSNSVGDRDHGVTPKATVAGASNSTNDIDMAEAFGALNWEDFGWF